MTIKTLLIGLGQIGFRYDINNHSNNYVYSHAKALTLNRFYQLNAGVDTSQKACNEFNKIYNIDTFTDVGEALNFCKPNLVVISAPTNVHYSLIKKVVSFHIPTAILCEKPLSYNLDESIAIVDICKRNNIKLFVNYVRRADTSIIEIKKQIGSEDFILPIKGFVWYTKGLFNSCSHYLDLTTHLFGRILNFKILNKGRTYNGDPEPDFLAFHEGGEVYFISAKEENYHYSSMEILFPKGRLRYDIGGASVTWQPAISSPLFDGYTELSRKESELGHGPHRIQLDFYNYLHSHITDQEGVLCTGDQALTVMLYLNKINDMLC